MYKKYKSHEEKVDHVKELTAKLEQGVKDIFNNPDKNNGFDPEAYKEYLKNISKFHRYSFNNCMLIAMQNPDASLVAGYKTWEKEFERHVKKGEKGLKILAPSPYKIWQEQNKIDPQTNQPVLDANGKNVTEKVQVTIPSYRAVTVFDVSQTEGRELPRALSHGYGKELKGNIENFDKFMEALKEISPVPIEYKTLYNGSKGYFSPGEEKIVINTDMEQIQTVKTGVHEVAHAILHDPAKGTEKDSGLTRGEKEVQAESVAFVVCQRFGIDTSDYSFSYVGNWSSGKELKELTASMSTIQKAAAGLIDSIEEKLKEMEHTKDAPDKKSENVKEDPEQETTKIELTKEPAHQNTAELSR